MIETGALKRLVRHVICDPLSPNRGCNLTKSETAIHHSTWAKISSDVERGDLEARVLQSTSYHYFGSRARGTESITVSSLYDITYLGYPLSHKVTVG